jgi:hypothetical protein
MKICAFSDCGNTLLHTCVRVELGLVEVLDDVLDRLDGAVPSECQLFCRCTSTHCLSRDPHFEVTWRNQFNVTMRLGQ